MGNTSQKELELIENSLSSSESPLGKQINLEYRYLKQYNNEHNDKSSVSPSKRPPPSETQSTQKILCNPIRIKKRIERFAKWFKMILPNEDIIKKTKSNVVSTTTSNSLDHPHHKTNSNTDLTNGNKTLLLLSENSFETSLRKYYENNTLHFSERVSKGPPDSLRWLSWMVLLGIPDKFDEKLYKTLCSESIEDKVDTQIKKDLNRTLNETINLSNNNAMYNIINKDIDREQSLYRVLHALACVDKELGYCQGVNFITGFLLNVSHYNEIETFYILVALFSTSFDNNFNIRGFFIDNFPLLNLYLYIFDTILQKELPSLRLHIKELDIPQEAWIGKWIQTLYTICLSNEFNIRIWDCIISNGLYYIISFSIGMMQIIEKDLMNIKDAFDFTEFFKDFFASSTEASEAISTKMKNAVVLEDIILLGQKNHKNYKAKNLFINLKEEFTTKVKSIGHYKLAYNLNFQPTPRSVKLNSHSNSNITMTNFHSNLSDEENADSCDEYESSNIVNMRQMNNYVFMIKDKNDNK